MASLVSTCMEHVIAIKRSSQPVCRGGEQQTGKEKRKRGKERKGKEKRKREKKENKGTEKKKRNKKEADGLFLSSLAFQRSELVRPRSKVQRFDERLRFKR